MKMAEQNRMNRALETREKEIRPAAKWTPPQLLPEVDEEPGYKMRWIRTSMGGVGDARNVSAKLREGWEPVKASQHPEAHTFVDPNSRFKDAIEVGGLILCKTPAEFIEQRDAHYRQLADSQMLSVDNSFMRESDARMPLFSDKRTTVTKGAGFGSGS
jgi:hypothetical protein